MPRLAIFVLLAACSPGLTFASGRRYESAPLGDHFRTPERLRISLSRSGRLTSSTVTNADGLLA